MANQILAGAVFHAGQVIAGVDADNPPYVGPPAQLILGSEQVNKVFSFSTNDLSVLHEITNPYGDGNWGENTSLIGRTLFIRGNIGHEINPNGMSYVAYNVDNLSSPPTIPSGGYKVYSNLVTTNDKVFAIVSPDGSHIGRELAEIDPTTLEKISVIPTPSGIASESGYFGGPPLFAHGGKVYKGDTDYQGSQTGTSNGKVFVFDAADGALLNTISAPGPSSNYSDIDRFGSNLSVNDSWLAITGYTSKIPVGNPLVSRGSVHVYDQNDLSASPVELFANNDQALLGSDVEVRGDLVFAGSRGEDGSDGRVHVFDMSTGGTLIHSLEASDQFTSDSPNLGYFITSTSTHLFVNAPNAKTSSTSDLRGAIHKFDLSDLSAAPVSIYGSEPYELYITGPMTHMTIAEPPAPPPAPPTPLSAKWIVVGAPFDDDGGSSSGTAFVFDATDPSASPTKIMASNAGQGQQFGESTAAFGDMIVVGASGANDNKGAVFVFDATDLSAEPTMLVASDGAVGDVFGCSVAVSDNYIVVGAKYDDPYGASSGSAYVFDANDLSAPHTKITANDGEYNDRFGGAVSVSGNFIVVGAQLEDDEGSSAGSVYVFTADNLSETPTKLTPSDLDAGHQFGTSVDTDGVTIVVGAPNSDNQSGAAYVFDASNLSSSPTKLTQGSGDPTDLDDLFGKYVSVDGDYIVIGATQNNSSGSNTGCVYVFDTNNLSAPPTELSAPDSVLQAKFGHSVSVYRDVITVGVNKDDHNGLTSTGAAYVFDASNLGTAPIKIVGDQDLGDCFGRSVSVG